MNSNLKKSILIGNGININFGGRAYSNEFIIKRIIFNALGNKYDPIFNSEISGREIANIFFELTKWTNEITEGKYDDIILPEEEDILFSFKRRYNRKIKYYYEVGLEDWLFIFHIFLLANKDLSDNWRSIKQGFEEMLLDAIYNDGDIQRIYYYMESPVKKWLTEYDSVFTLNYDNNIEKLIKCPVFHLHGDYGTRRDSENPETVIGFLRASMGQNMLIPEFEHCYCNAIVNYSGEYKYKIASAFEKGENGLRDLEKSGVPLEYLPAPIAKLVQVHLEHPELPFCSDYHFDKLRSLTGEIHIVGMSPNNDEHIFKLINESNLEKIVFYYYSECEAQEILPVKQKVEYESVKMLWKRLKAKPKEYNCNYPNLKIERIKPFIEIFNLISGDEASNEDILNSVNSLPKNKANALCKTVLERIEGYGAPKDEKELEYQFHEISRIALRNGVLPVALYIHLMMYMNSNR